MASGTSSNTWASHMEKRVQSYYPPCAILLPAVCKWNAQNMACVERQKSLEKDLWKIDEAKAVFVTRDLQPGTAGLGDLLDAIARHLGLPRSWTEVRVTKLDFESAFKALQDPQTWKDPAIRRKRMKHAREIWNLCATDLGPSVWQGSTVNSKTVWHSPRVSLNFPPWAIDLMERGKREHRKMLEGGHGGSTESTRLGKRAETKNGEGQGLSGGDDARWAEEAAGQQDSVAVHLA